MLAATATLLLAAPAGAQDLGDPYGGTTTTTGTPPSGGEAACSVDVGAGEVGDGATATITDLAASTTVHLQVAGIPVAEATSPPGPPGEGTTLSIPFTVPEVAAGFHLVTAAAVDLTLTCAARFQVLGDAIVQGNVVEPDDSRGPLPRTGIYVALLLGLALALLLIGRAMLAAARRRRRRAARAARLVAAERAELLLARRVGSK